MRGKGADVLEVAEFGETDNLVRRRSLEGGQRLFIGHCLQFGQRKVAVAIGVEGFKTGYPCVHVDESDARIDGSLVGARHDAMGELTQFALKDFEPGELPIVGHAMEFSWNIVVVDGNHNAHLAVPLDGGPRSIVSLPVYGCRLEGNLPAEAHEEVV